MSEHLDPSAEHQSQDEEKPVSPTRSADVEAGEMRELIKSGRAKTWHQAHQILRGREPTSARVSDKPLTEEDQTRLEESQRRLRIARNFRIDATE